MIVFIKDSEKNVNVRIYGKDGKEHTEEFFDRYFGDLEDAHFTTDEERFEYGTNAVYTVEKKSDFRFFADNIGKIQQSISYAAYEMIGGTSEKEYTFDGDFYMI